MADNESLKALSVQMKVVGTDSFIRTTPSRREWPRSGHSDGPLVPSDGSGGAATRTLAGEQPVPD